MTTLKITDAVAQAWDPKRAFTVDVWIRGISLPEELADIPPEVHDLIQESRLLQVSVCEASHRTRDSLDLTVALMRRAVRSYMAGEDRNAEEWPAG